jgi:hydrogenase maturation protease
MPRRPRRSAMAHPARVLVLGLGNPILTDDGVGVLVARGVQAALPPGSPVEVSEVSVGGLALMESMVGHDRVILVDALQGEGIAPGAIERLSLEDLRSISPTRHSTSPHDANLITALEAGRQMGLHLPDEIVIYGIGVADVLDFGDCPTPAVGAAVPRAVAAVLADLARAAVIEQET